MRSCCVLDCVDKIARPLDRDDSSTLAHDFGKIDRGIAGTRADIEHAVAKSNASLFPAIQNYRAPGAMLDSQSLEFFIVSTENIIAFL